MNGSKVVFYHLGFEIQNYNNNARGCSVSVSFSKGTLVHGRGRGKYVNSFVEMGVPRIVDQVWKKFASARFYWILVRFRCVLFVMARDVCH